MSSASDPAQVRMDHLAQDRREDTIEQTIAAKDAGITHLREQVTAAAEQRDHLAAQLDNVRDQLDRCNAERQRLAEELAEARGERDCAQNPERPRIVVLCGSTRFRAEITDAKRRFTLAGYIVLAPGVFGHDGDEITDEQKEALDDLHFRKIDLADEVYVVNPGGYIGESTRLELSYARRMGKPVCRLVEAAEAGERRG